MLNTTFFTGDLVYTGGEITEQQGRGALFPLPFPLTGGMAFLSHRTSLATALTSVHPMSRFLIIRNITPFIHPFSQQRFIEHLLCALEVQLSLVPSTTSKDEDGFKTTPPVLPVISVVQKHSIFWNQELLNLSIAIFPAFPLFVFYNSMKSHLPQAIGTVQLSLKPTKKKETRKRRGGKLMVKAISMVPHPRVQQVLW